MAVISSLCKKPLTTIKDLFQSMMALPPYQMDEKKEEETLYHDIGIPYFCAAIQASLEHMWHEGVQIKHTKSKHTCEMKAYMAVLSLDICILGIEIVQSVKSSLRVRELELDATLPGERSHPTHSNSLISGRLKRKMM